MTTTSADVVICGVGLAGAAAAYHLTVTQGVRNLLIVDPRPPLSLTSNSSTECYRNWWPGPGDAMVGLMNRSIDLLEAIARSTDNRIQLNRRGYLFATGEQAKVAQFIAAAHESSTLGAGPTRVHTGAADDPPYVPARAAGWEDMPAGADVIVDPQLIQRYFPFLTAATVAVLHARRCGWLNAQQLGSYLLEQALAHGARLAQATVGAVDTTGGAVRGVALVGGEAHAVATECFINAAGPGFKAVGALLGLDLPVFSELHMRVAFDDHAGAIPQHAPLVIWMDETQLAGDESGERFPAGVHLRPSGADAHPAALGLWTIDTTPRVPVFPVDLDQRHGELTLRALTTVIPSLRAILDHGPRIHVDGGYYTKTAENRPLIGPTPIAGAYLMGALSGFGVMGCCGFGELLAAHVTHSALPPYAPAFLLGRYDDLAYQILLGSWGSSGQL